MKSCIVALLLVALASDIDSSSIVRSRVSSNQQFVPAGKVGDRPVFKLQSSAYKSISAATGGCGCVGYNCGCCETLDFPQLKIHDTTACVNLTYLSYDIGVSITLTLNYITIYNKTVSVRNPPPICAGVPHFDAADLCIIFSHLDWSNETFSGCVAIDGELYGIVVAHKDLGCFHFAELRKSVELSNVESNEESQNMVPSQYQVERKNYPIDPFRNWPKIRFGTVHPVVIFTDIEADSGDGEIEYEVDDDDDHNDPFDDLDDLLDDKHVDAIVGHTTSFFNSLKKHFEGFFDAISKIF